MRKKLVEYYINEKGCHICVSHTGADGYPHYYRDGKCRKIVRHLWEIIYGKQSRSDFLLHTCDNPKCINLNHIKLGSPKENTHDMLSKNRQAKGSKNGNAKLSEQLVYDIKQIGFTKSERILARMFNINRATIGYIRRGQTWKHI